MEWETVIGLEVHTQLLTQSKIFSGASTAFGADPNTQACAIDLGMPGVLPVLNKEAVRLAVKLGLSINSEIASYSTFARKNYFYPDLPKGYQISQFDQPIVGKGFLMITLEDGSQKKINITRAHLEEDAGKSLHEGMKNASGIDLNRAGTPLLEIVSEPDMRSAKEAVAYLKALHTLVRYLGVSDANMQEGSFRCDVNVSIRKKGAELGTRAEIKNVNSFRFVEKAIEFEVARQKEVLENGGTIVQETRQYDAENDVTRSMRSKEQAHDYRYFPDPDLLPLVLEDKWIATIKASMPELPWEKRARFIQDYELSEYDADLLSHHMDLANYFEEVLKKASNVKPKLVANWVSGDLLALLNKSNLTILNSPVSTGQLAALVSRISDQTISNSMGKTVFEAMANGEGEVDEIIEKKGLKQITDSSEIEKIVDEVIQNNPSQVADYRGGKDKLMAFFVGQVMKLSRGKANPEQVNELLLKKLKI
jgi:aspartyl-tRNA(Asn)/glutamyl-tRNA(Gln) amidotransferase subunit B